MHFEKTEQHTYRNHMSFLFAWVQNPSCSRLKQDNIQFPASNSTWKPRQRFMDWAFQQDNVQQGVQRLLSRYTVINGKTT